MDRGWTAAYDLQVTLTIELDRELPGVMAYGRTEAEVVASVKALALRVLADRLEHGELGADSNAIAFSERPAA